MLKRRLKMIKAYASYFVSYLISEIKDLSEIKSVILFGSVARGESTKKSDIDIFIDVDEENKNAEKNIEKITESFYKTREALLFKNRGIDNKINAIVGKIDKWPKLKESIESHGITLYGAYTPSLHGGKKYLIIFWDKIKKNRGAFLNAVYGYKIKGKKYAGFVEKCNGKKVGKSSIMVPSEQRNEIFSLIKKYGVSAKIIEVYMDKSGM